MLTDHFPVNRNYRGLVVGVVLVCVIILFRFSKRSSRYSSSMVYIVDSFAYQAVSVWSLREERWFFPEPPRTSHLARRCPPGTCRSVHPTPLEPCKSRSHRWMRSAVCFHPRPPDLHSSCSDQSLPPRGWTGKCVLTQLKFIDIDIRGNNYFSISGLYSR